MRFTFTQHHLGGGDAIYKRYVFPVFTKRTIHETKPNPQLHSGGVEAHAPIIYLRLLRVLIMGMSGSGEEHRLTLDLRR